MERSLCHKPQNLGALAYVLYYLHETPRGMATKRLQKENCVTLGMKNTITIIIHVSWSTSLFGHDLMNYTPIESPLARKVVS